VTASRALAEARGTLERAIAARVFPAASVNIGSSAGPLWSDAFGTLSFEEGAPPATVTTPFDLASLTKVVATTTLLMDLVRTERVHLDAPVANFFEEWRGADRDRVTLRDLLEHASGLAPRLVDPPPPSRREFEPDICMMPLECAPRRQSIYSDLDFILLGFLVADLGGASLPQLFERVTALVASTGLAPAPGAVLTFDLSPDQKHVAAPTLPLDEDSRRGRSLAGEVHDNYAAALGGAAGHAGLFGSAPALGEFARTVLRAARGDVDSPAPFDPKLIAAFTARSTVPGSSRALGWDTMLPTSSCGTRMSARAFGHVGFTGTSLWLDPERDRYFVLLTNRAGGGGTLDQMRTVRRAFHDALGDF
jgi:CubicO group peptidase (beta-lactamase class C family)